MAEFMGKVEQIAKEKIVRRGIVQEFRDFINRGNVVDISVAFVMGAAFKTVVDSFAGSADQPGILGGLIGAVFGGNQPDFSKKYVTVNGSHIELGKFATAGLNFLLVAIALFVVVKFYNRFRDRDDGVKSEESATTNELLTEIRDELRRGRG
ncbi:MAG: large-conductance mechanosensitive channel protein MscL [Actinomycetota bacterium]|jgi:large conductance mechanosensitive channel